LAIPGAKLLFGGEPVVSNIPNCYGSFKPTAIFVPLSEIRNHFDTVTTEVFGPFQILTSFEEPETDSVIDIINSFKNHLTAAIVSSPNPYQN